MDRRAPSVLVDRAVAAADDSNANPVRRRAIFIIDADADARHDIETRLATLRLTNPTVALADGEHALQTLRHAAELGLARVPALVLLDVELPGCSGLDIVRAMRETIGLENVPVVVLSAVDDAAKRHRGIPPRRPQLPGQADRVRRARLRSPRPRPALVVDVMILRVRSIPSWIWYLGFGALCCGLFLTFDNDWAKAGVQVPVYATSAVLLARCWWIRRATQREPLLALAVVAFGLYFCASIWGVILPLTANGPAASVPAPIDVCFLLSYTLLGLLLWKIGSRSAGERRRDILDTLIVIGGVAPAFWLFLIKPLFAFHAPFPALATYVAYPTLVFGLLAMTVRLFFLAARRTAPHLLLGGWILLELIADVVYLRVSVQGAYVYGQWWQAMWIVSAACVGAVALHPDTGLLFERRTTRPVSSSRRLYVLAFCLAAPILLIGFGELQQTGDLAVLVPACAALALMGLLTMRLSGLMVDNASQVRARQELLRLSDDLTHQALHDPLTGLGNRVLFAAARGRCPGPAPHRW